MYNTCLVPGITGRNYNKKMRYACWCEIRKMAVLHYLFYRFSSVKKTHLEAESVLIGRGVGRTFARLGGGGGGI